jgi:hypothetical protein
MGAGSSTPMTPAQREAARQKREEKRKKKQDEQAKKDALKREKKAWLRNYRARLEKKWWHAGWWPIYEWWKEKSAWEEELYRRRKEGLLDSEGVPLRAHHD